MELDKIKEIVRRKPPFFLLVSLAYLIVVGLLRWGIHPTLGEGVFFIGGIIGVYFLDVAEVFFQLNPSPFRSIVFAASFVAMSFFVVTSSGSTLASGLVLSLYLTMVLWLVGEWQIQGNVTTWYRMVAGQVSIAAQKWTLISFIVLFIIETILFTR
jgi:hypothetical protein